MYEVSIKPTPTQRHVAVVNYGDQREIPMFVGHHHHGHFFLCLFNASLSCDVLVLILLLVLVALFFFSVLDRGPDKLLCDHPGGPIMSKFNCLQARSWDIGRPWHFPGNMQTQCMTPRGGDAMGGRDCGQVGVS